MRITDALTRATTRRTPHDRGFDDDRFRDIREHDLTQPTAGVRTVLWATPLCLVLAALLTSGKLVDIAERQPIGSERDRWVDAADAVDRVANFLSLNRPYDAIVELRHAGDDPGQAVETIDEVAAEAGIEVAEPPVTAVPATTTAADEGDPAPTTSAPPTTTTTEPLVSLRAVGPDDPLRVYVAGDSQAEFLGQSLVANHGDRAMEVVTNHQISTSLARPDYFNWPAELRSVIEDGQPEAVVMFLGANEYQDMEGADGSRLVRGSEEWRVEWARRLAILLDVLEADDRHVFWIGQPPMRDRAVAEGVDIVNQVARPVVESRSHASYMDIWELFGGSGGYRERVVGPDGSEQRARVDDGIHLTREASGWVADMVMERMDRIWTFEP